MSYAVQQNYICSTEGMYRNIYDSPISSIPRMEIVTSPSSLKLDTSIIYIYIGRRMNELPPHAATWVNQTKLMVNERDQEQKSTFF